jgi:hypothetical protein
MGQQVIEIVHKLIELAVKTCCESFQLHDIDGESTEIARAICDTNPLWQNQIKLHRLKCVNPFLEDSKDSIALQTV